MLSNCLALFHNLISDFQITSVEMFLILRGSLEQRWIISWLLSWLGQFWLDYILAGWLAWPVLVGLYTGWLVGLAGLISK